MLWFLSQYETKTYCIQIIEVAKQWRHRKTQCWALSPWTHSNRHFCRPWERQVWTDPPRRAICFWSAMSTISALALIPSVLWLHTAPKYSKPPAKTWTIAHWTLTPHDILYPTNCTVHDSWVKIRAKLSHATHASTPPMHLCQWLGKANDLTYNIQVGTIVWTM